MSWLLSRAISRDGQRLILDTYFGFLKFDSDNTDSDGDEDEDAEAGAPLAEVMADGESENATSQGVAVAEHAESESNPRISRHLCLKSNVAQQDDLRLHTDKSEWDSSLCESSVRRNLPSVPL